MTNDIDAQVRNLLLKSDFGTLSTHSVDCHGYPFASIVPLGFDDFNRPILLLTFSVPFHEMARLVNRADPLLPVIFRVRSQQDANCVCSRNSCRE